MLAFVRGALIAGAFLYLLLCVLLYFFQRSLIYFPQPAVNPGSTIGIKTPAGRTLVSCKLRTGGSPALIYFGGNAEDVSLNLPEFAQAFPRYSLYLMHYRGYGGSDGTPSEQALFADALALFDEVHRHHQQIIVIGRSLGSGVAAYLVSQRQPVQHLVLITPFDSLTAVGARHYPYFPVRLLARDRYDSAKYAAAIHTPTLILAAGDDTVVPNFNSENLRDRFKPGIAEYRVIPGATHNSISGELQYWQLLTSVLLPLQNQ